MSAFSQAVLKVAKENPEFARGLTAELKKTAGGYTVAVKHGAKIGPRQIKAICQKSGAFKMDYFDWKKIQWDKPEKTEYMGPPGIGALWRVFHHGEFGNRDEGYIWGLVFAGVGHPRGNTVEVNSTLYVKI